MAIRISASETGASLFKLAKTQDKPVGLPPEFWIENDLAVVVVHVSQLVALFFEHESGAGYVRDHDGRVDAMQRAPGFPRRARFRIVIDDPEHAARFGCLENLREQTWPINFRPAFL